MKHEQTPEGAAEFADSVDRQRWMAFSAIQARRFAAAFPTVQAREAYLVSRIEKCDR